MCVSEYVYFPLPVFKKACYYLAYVTAILSQEPWLKPLEAEYIFCGQGRRSLSQEHTDTQHGKILDELERQGTSRAMTRKAAHLSIQTSSGA